MKINKNVATIAVVVVALIAILMITQTNIAQMEYYKTPFVDTLGNMYRKGSNNKIG